MESSNIIFFILLAFFSYFFNRFILSFFYKSKYSLLLDNDYKKPQAFHKDSVYRLGGTSIFFTLFLAFLYLTYSKNIFFIEYISFGASFFILGLLDDLKIRILPKFRLSVMIIFLMFLIIYNELYIERTGLEFLNYLLEIDIFSLFFIVLCFLFIINGANLIDGFNGLLGLHSLIIFSILLSINFINTNIEISYVLLFTILSILVFLIFNFPKAKVFLGDGGSYFLGTVIAISAINTSIANPFISPFYFCILLFYLFFEVFFSFFRKLIRKKSPLEPDGKHLHMLLYKVFLKKNNDKLKSNYSVSIIINTIYLILTIPSILMMKNGMFCKYYSIVFFVTYLLSYKLLNKLDKKNL